MRFRTKMIAGVVLIEAVLLLALIMAGLQAFQDNHRHQIVEFSDSTAALLASAAKEPLLASDLATLNAFVKQIVATRGVAYARVRNDTGVAVAFAGDPGLREKVFVEDSQFDSSDSDQVYDVRKVIRDGELVYGAVELGLSTAEHVEVLAASRRTAGFIAAGEIILMAIFSFILGTYLTRQLKSLEDGAEEIASGNVGHQLVVEGGDELSRTASAFNTMSQRVKSLVDEKSRQNHLLEIIRKAQTKYVRHSDPVEAMRELLLELMAYTGSKQAFLSEVCVDNAGEKFLRTFDYEFNEDSAEGFYSKNDFREVLITNQTGVLAKTFLHGERMVINDGLRYGQSSFPPGHPELTSYAGIPLEIEGRTIGMVGIAGRARGYTQDLLQELELVWKAAANLILAYRDLREKEQTRQEVLALHNRNRQLLDSVADGIYGVDAEGVITFINHSAAHMLGREPESLVGQHQHALLHDPEFKHAGGEGDVCEACARIVDGQKHATQKDTFVRKDGSLLPVEYSSSPLSEDSEHAGAVVAFRDITDRKRAEQAMKQAADAAIESARIKSEFLANMSHEIRTPMNGVIGMLQLMGKTGLNDKQAGYLKTAQGSANSLLTIINDILDLSKLEAGKLKVEKVDFDMYEVLEQVQDLLAPRARQKGIDLDLNISGRAPRYLQGDPQRLTQVLINLTGNAIKFTEAGGVYISVETSSAPGEPVMLRFAVVDTGIGVDKEAQDRLFNSFEQADGSTSRKYGGTGLGLAISRQLVELMAGEIRMESTPGEGSTFWFNLPFAVSHSFREAGPLDFSGDRALVISSRGTVRSVLKDFLEKIGVQVRLAISQGEGVAAIQQLAGTGASYRFVFLESGLGDLSLEVFVQRFKVLSEDWSNTQLIVLTDNGMEGAAQPEEAASAYLAQPIRHSSLFDTLCLLKYGDRHDADAPRKDDREMNGTSGGSMQGKILLVEDNEVNQIVAEEMLKEFGFEVDIAGNGRVAVEQAAGTHYDLVLMDCQMPEMDGYEATEVLRNHEERTGESRRIIIALTANAMEGDRQRCIEAGMDDYLTKPFRDDDLRRKLEQWLRQAAPERDEEAKDSPQNCDLVDADAILSLKQLVKDRADGLYEVYFRSAEDSVAKMHELLSLEEYEQLGRAIHSLKGGSGNIGARAVYELCVQAEKYIRDGNVSRVAGVIGELTHLIDQSRHQVQALLAA